VATGPGTRCHKPLTSTYAGGALGGIHREPSRVRVELEALDPGDLRGLYEAVLADYWDDDAYDAVLDVEGDDRQGLEGGQQ
jgi:hypothetical protein